MGKNKFSAGDNQRFDNSRNRGQGRGNGRWQGNNGHDMSEQLGSIRTQVQSVTQVTEPNELFAVMQQFVAGELGMYGILGYEFEVWEKSRTGEDGQEQKQVVVEYVDAMSDADILPGIRLRVQQRTNERGRGTYVPLWVIRRDPESFDFGTSPMPEVTEFTALVLHSNEAFKKALTAFYEGEERRKHEAAAAARVAKEAEAVKTTDILARLRAKAGTKAAEVAKEKVEEVKAQATTDLTDFMSADGLWTITDPATQAEMVLETYAYQAGDDKPVRRYVKVVAVAPGHPLEHARFIGFFAQSVQLGEVEDGSKLYGPILKQFKLREYIRPILLAAGAVGVVPNTPPEQQVDAPEGAIPAMPVIGAEGDQPRMH